MHDAAHAAKLLAAAGTSGPAVHHMGQGGTMARRLGHRVAIVEIEPPVKRACSHHHVACGLAVAGDDGCDQRPFAFVQQRDGMIGVAVRHDGGHRAKSLGVVHMRGGIGIGTVEQHRRDKGTFLRIRTLDRKSIGVAKDTLCL